MPRRIRWRIHRHAGEGKPGAAVGQPDEYLELDAEQLSGIFATPRWLRELGVMSWLLVGVAVMVVALVWLLTLTETITGPVITASIIAAVLSPVIGLLQRRGVPRSVGTVIVFLSIVALAVLLTYIIIAGIGSQSGSIQSHLHGAVDKIKGWLDDAGASTTSAQHAADHASSTVSSGFKTLLRGIAGGLTTLASLAVFLSFTALSLFLLLKDGPRIRQWGERHVGLPYDVSHIIFERTLQSLRQYFGGVTIVAAFNGIVIGLGALIVGVPLAGTITIVNFVAAYIPFLGAWTAGAFTVLIALGTKGTTAAIVMIVIVLLANGALQQIVQPIAFGATLGIHPLAVLIVTISGGALFGTVGLILAAPLTSAAVKISGDIARARAEEEKEGAAAGAAPPLTEEPPPEPEPAQA
jgi:predicted PurR-regulated permease PerM